MIDSDEPTWIDYDVALAYHELLTELYGGAPGVRDPHVVESALARARFVHRYESQDPAGVAATYAHGIAKNHGFVDGNKGTALACALAFLRVNGLPCLGDQAEAVVMVEGLASGEVDRDTFAGWLRKMR